EDVPLLEHHGAEVATHADVDLMPIDLELGVAGDLLLHLCRSVQCAVGGGKGRHDLIAHGLDDGAPVLLRGIAHDVDADRDHVARSQVAHQLVEPRGTDYVSKEDGELYVFSHAADRLRRPALSMTAATSRD